MSQAHDQKSPSASMAPKFSLWRSLRFPLAVLIVLGGIFAIPWTALALNVDTSDWPVPLMFFSQWVPPLLAAVLLVLWWVFFFRGVGAIARLALLALLCGGVVGFLMYSVRKVEMTMGTIAMVPRIHWIWETSADEKQAAYLEAATDSLPPIDGTVGPEDFPSYRGPKRDGVIHFAKLQRNWDSATPTVVWRHPCPGGYAGIAVAGNIVVTLEKRNDQEAVVCYDRATGRPRWAHAYAVFYKDKLRMGDGPRSTPTIDNKHIYSLGASGDLVCLTVEGKLRWSKNILSLAQAKNVKWGLSGSPLIVGDLVIANAGIDEEAPLESSLIAFEQTTGDVRWKSGKRKAGYSSPQLVRLGNVPQILLFDGEGLVSYDPGTGKELWQFPWITAYDMNSIQPVIVGDDRVFISSEAANGCVLLRVKPADRDGASWTVEPVWENHNLAARYANSVTDGKTIYGLHNTAGALRSLDVGDGSIQWRGDSFGPGQMLLVDDLLLIVNGATGDVALFDTALSTPKVLGRFMALEKRDKTWNTPAFAGDQLFLRNQAEIVCVKLVASRLLR